MNIRNSSVALISAAAFTLAPLLSLADTAAVSGTASTNAAPAPAPAETAVAPTPAAPSAPTDTTAPTTPTERPSTYTVASGDSLWAIAHKFGTTVVKLRKANNLKKGALLHPGQVLKVPPAPSDATK